MDRSEGFSFSIKAQNVEAQFYNKQAIVYVEGDDDLNFWHQFFYDTNFEIKKVDGCKNLDKKIEQIESCGLKCIVACDSDYRSFAKSKKDHPLVIRTLSHSIECIMYCPTNVAACIQKLSKSFCDKTDDIQASYHKFGNDIKELIAYDIANNIYQVGKKVAGDSCKRFLKSDKSIHVDLEKISQYLALIKESFEGIDINSIIQEINADNRTMRQIAKGHFQTSFVTNLIKYFVKQITGTNTNLPDDVLYALLVQCTPSCCKDCVEKKSIKMKIEQALYFLKIA